MAKRLRMPFQEGMTRERELAALNKNIEVIVSVVYNILLTNDICCGKIIEAVDEIKKSKYYSFKMKEHVNKLDKERRRYEKYMNSIIKDLGWYFADLNDNFMDTVANDIDILYFSMKKVFDREKYEDSSMLAKVELARSLCEFSCCQYDNRIQELKSIDRALVYVPIDYLRLTNMYYLIRKVMSEFKHVKNISEGIEECQAALNVVMRKMGDFDEIVNTLKRTDNERADK